jgi:hypothetical protein
MENLARANKLAQFGYFVVKELDRILGFGSGHMIFLLAQVYRRFI